MIRHPRRTHAAFIAATAVLASAGIPAAQAQSSVSTLGTVEVTSDYDPNDVRPESISTATKTKMAARDIPQTIDTLDVNKYKSYGINDLSIMLDGVPGVTTSYDMRGEGVMIRGFSADSGDIYRDGVRESGQVRRSTANVERIEVLKGPASVLYGRSSGGGIVNLISKRANFETKSSATLRAGSWHNYGGTFDLNKVITPDVAVRLTVDREQADSFRSGIRNRNEMVSPSIAYDNHQGLRWVGQYTHDNVWRVPDRGPSYDNLPAGVSVRTGFQHPDDYVEDRLRVMRSDLSYDFNDKWSLRWIATHREASQDFDHFFAGTYCNANGRTSTNATCTYRGLVRQSYAWQQTENKTDTQTLDLTGKFNTGPLRHDTLVGVEFTDEVRHPRLFSTSATNSYINPFAPGGWTPKAAQGAPSQHNKHEATSQALYLQDLISITEQWKVLAGLRYDRFDFKSTNRLTNATRSYQGNTVSPRVGVVWQPTIEHSLYGSYSKSFAPYGGRGMLSVSVDPTAVYDAEPQHSRQMEAGIKSEWMDGRLSTTLAVYELEHYNIRYQPDAINDPFTYAVRGKERSRGVELSAAGRLAPSWYVRGGVGFMDAEVAQDVSNPALNGKALQDTGRRNGNLFLRYAPEGHFYGEVGVTHSSSRWLNAANTSRLPGYTRWDALIGYRAAPWTATLAFSNIFDKEYWRSSSMPGAPRSVLLSVNYQF